MGPHTISRRNSLKLFALTGTTVLTIPNALWSCSEEKKRVRFGLLTDSHYADREPAGTRFYRDSILKMEEAITALNAQDIDFLIHLGDFKDQDPLAKPEDTLAYLKEIEGVFQQFKGAKYHALGNHDVDSIRKAEFLNHIANNGQQVSESYYSFDSGGIHFIVLDANYDADGTDHFFAEGSDWENATIPEEELTWFKDELKKTEKPVVVFCHHPLYEFYKEGSKFHVTNYTQVQEVMQDSGKVLACLHGHVHKEDFTEIKGIHYITQLGMVDYAGLENNSFSIVELSANQLKITGYKRASDAVFSI